MRVCLLNDSFPPVIDGVANTIMNYAEVLSNTGQDEAIVATPRYPDADYSCYPYRVVPYRSINTTTLTAGYRTGNPFSGTALEELRDFKPDIIHTHCPMVSCVMARLLQDVTDVPLIFTYHTKFDVDIARCVKDKILQKEGIKVIIDNISACDEVWTVSRGAGENLRSLGYEGSYRVVNNGVDFAKGRVDDETVRGTTAGYDLPEGVPVYLFVGRLMTYKGLPLILDALRILKGEGKDFRMVFIGDGKDAGDMKEKTREYGLTDKVFFTGAIHDRTALRAWNTRADLFLFPSTYDTNGIVVREAAACGLASVLIKDSCAAEGITDSRNGYLIDETPEAMAALLSGLGDDLSSMHKTGQHAMDEIYISWSDAVHTARDYYEDIIDRWKRGLLVRRDPTPSDRLLELTSWTEDSNRRIREHMEQLTEILSEHTGQFAEMISEHREQLAERVSERTEQFTEKIGRLYRG